MIRVQRGVDYLDVATPNHFLIITTDNCCGKKLVPSSSSALKIQIANDCNIQPQFFIGLEMVFGNATRSHYSNLGTVTPRQARQILERGCGNPGRTDLF